MAELDKACCSLAPVTTHDYEPKGTYTELAGLKVYSTGSSTSTRGVVAVYDVFGYMPQTLQGADRLAERLKALVLMPDFFKGQPLPQNVYPADTEEKKETAQKFMNGIANVDHNVAKLTELVKEAKGKYESVRGWGAYGFCWGGKVCVLAAGPGTELKAAGTAHPSRLEATDADKLTVPFICLFSQLDGTPELMKEYQEALERKKDNVVEHYSTMKHGWMAARGFRDGDASVKEFERGYNQLADFFSKHL